MKFLKPTLVIITILALTYTVNANNLIFKEVNTQIANKTTIEQITFNGNLNHSAILGTVDNNQPSTLPLNNDILFAFTAIATLSAYLVFKR